MTTIENCNNPTICNLDHLSDLMGVKKPMIKKIMDTFLVQVQEELKSINDAILKKDYYTIKNLAHIMESSVSIMGISTALPVLHEIVELGGKGTAMERIITLNHQLNLICQQAFEEINNYYSS